MFRINHRTKGTKQEEIMMSRMKTMPQKLFKEVLGLHFLISFVSSQVKASPMRVLAMMKCLKDRAVGILFQDLQVPQD